jgi:hypothetical protein
LEHYVDNENTIQKGAITVRVSEDVDLVDANVLNIVFLVYLHPHHLHRFHSAEFKRGCRPSFYNILKTFSVILVEEAVNFDTPASPYNLFPNLIFA